MMERFCLHLCGHNHKTEVMQVWQHGAEHALVRWVGRSIFGLRKHDDGKIDRSHGYVSGELRVVGKEKGELQFMPRWRMEYGDVWSLVPDQKCDLPREFQNERTRAFPVRLCDLPSPPLPVPGVVTEVPPSSASVGVTSPAAVVPESDAVTSESRSSGSVAETPPSSGKDQYDVILLHCPGDQADAKKLSVALDGVGLRTFLWEQGKAPSQRLNEMLGTLLAAAIAAGRSGATPWDDKATLAVIEQVARNGCALVPVLLPNAGAMPDLPPVLKGVTGVDLRTGFNETSLHRLVCHLLLPRVVSFLRDLPVSRPALHKEMVLRLSGELPRFRARNPRGEPVELLDAVWEYDVHSVLAAMCRALSSGASGPADPEGWLEVIRYLLPLAAANPRWLREAGKQERESGLVGTGRRDQPLAHASLIAALFDVAVRLDGDKPEGWVPIRGEGRGVKGIGAKLRPPDIARRSTATFGGIDHES
jgi:hypothetical protein